MNRVRIPNGTATVCAEMPSRRRKPVIGASALRRLRGDVDEAQVRRPAQASDSHALRVDGAMASFGVQKNGCNGFVLLQPFLSFPAATHRSDRRSVIPLITARIHVPPLRFTHGAGGRPLPIGHLEVV